MYREGAHSPISLRPSAASHHQRRRHPRATTSLPSREVRTLVVGELARIIRIRISIGIYNAAAPHTGLREAATLVPLPRCLLVSVFNRVGGEQKTLHAVLTDSYNSYSY